MSSSSTEEDWGIGLGNQDDPYQSDGTDEYRHRTLNPAPA
jgi:hypothetical protein